MSKPTAADVRAALVLRYPAKSHALMFEVAPRTGGGTRYADAVAVGLWASHGHAIEGFEIKVARSDWLNEMKQPEKSEPVMRYCHRWWLVCPKGVADTDELPTNWGMLELQENGTLKTRVQAPKLEAVPVTVGFFASLVRRGCESDNEVVTKLLERERDAMYKSIREEIDRQGRGRLTYQQEEAIKAAERLESLKARTGIDFANYHYSSDWFAAVELLHTLNSDYGRGSLKQLREQMAGIIESIDKSALLAPREIENKEAKAA